MLLIPVHDDNDDSGIPYVTFFLMAMCLAIDAGGRFLPSGFLQIFIEKFSLGGAIAGPGFSSLFHDPVRWRWCLAAVFVHSNMILLLLSLWMLWTFGDNVEYAMGRVRYALFVLLAGVGGNFLLLMFEFPGINPGGIGMLGVICAIIGAYAFYFPRARLFMNERWIWLVNIWSYFAFLNRLEFEMKVRHWAAILFAALLFMGLALTMGFHWGRGGYYAPKLILNPTLGHNFLVMAGLLAAGVLLARVFRDPDVALEYAAEPETPPYKDPAEVSDRDYSPEDRLGRRPLLEVMRKKGAAEREKTKRERGW